MSTSRRKPKGHVIPGSTNGLAGMLHQKGWRTVSVREMDRAIERIHCSDSLLGRQHGAFGLRRAKQR